MSITLADIRDSFKDSPFIEYLGFEIVSFEEGNVVLKLPIKEQLFNVNHTLHGGVHASLLDTVQGMTIRSVYKTRVNTINLTTHFLAPVTTGEVYAKAKLLQSGYKIVTAEAVIEDGNGKLLAKGTGTFKIIRAN